VRQIILLLGEYRRRHQQPGKKTEKSRESAGSKVHPVLLK